MFVQLLYCAILHAFSLVDKPDELVSGVNIVRKPALQLSVPTPKRAYISNALLPRMDKLIPKTCLTWWFRVASSPGPLAMRNNSVTFDPPSYNSTVQRSMLKKHSWGEPGDKAWFRGNFSLNDVEPSICVAYCTSRWCRLASPISEAVGWLVCVCGFLYANLEY